MSLERKIITRIDNEFEYLFEYFDGNQFEISSLQDIYHPLLRVNIVEKKELKKYIKTLKNNFVQEYGLFEMDTFLKQIMYTGLVYELKLTIETIEKGNTFVYDNFKNDYLLSVHYPNQVTKSLILFEKDLIHLKFYFKTLLETIHKTINKFSKEEIPLPFEKESIYDALIKKELEKDNYKIVTRKKFTKTEKLKITPQRENIKGFKYSGYDFVKISALRNELISEQYIDKEISLPDFRAIFDNKEVKKKITWIKSLALLNFLITTLFSEGIIKADEDKKWVITAHCFVLKKKTSLIHFDSDKIRTSNKVGEKPSNKMYSILKSINIL